MEDAMTTRTDEVLIDIEDQGRQLYHRFKVNDVTVLVDGTPEGDAAIGMTIDLLLAAPDLLAALKACEAYLQGVEEAAERMPAEIALQTTVKAALAKAGE